MTNIFFCSLLEASIIVSVAILLLLIFHKRLTQYSPSCRMIFWMILACRLLIPCPVGILYFGTPPHNTALAVGLGIVWLIGAVLLFGGHLLAYLRFERKMQRGRAASALSMSEQYQIQAVFEKVKAALGVKSSVELWISAEASGPMLLGFLRPKVVLPDCMLAQEKLEMIFRHELLHHRRHDCWYRLLMLLTQSVHWFNPLVWLMARRAAEDLESACDRSVIKEQSRKFVEEYAQALLETAKCLLQRKKVRQTVLVSYLSSGAQRLKERLVELFQPTRREGGPLIILLALLAVLGIYIV